MKRSYQALERHSAGGRKNRARARAYHVMAVMKNEDLPALFPLSVETL
jgi:hypothetical protein